MRTFLVVRIERERTLERMMKSCARRDAQCGIVPHSLTRFGARLQRRARYGTLCAIATPIVTFAIVGPS